MKRVVLLAAAVAVVALTAAPALAQRQRGGFGGGAMLLGQKSVQEELKLSEDQKKKVTEITAKFQGLGALSQDERRQKVEEITKEVNQFIKDDLKPEQGKRLKQIGLQFSGVAASLSKWNSKLLACSNE